MFKNCCGETGYPPNKATSGRLSETLDRTLEPRITPGKPGRPAGARNYHWTPEMDKRLIEFWTRCSQGGTAPPGGWLAFSKQVMASRLMELCPRESKPREDSLRRAVERRMAFLGLSTGNPHKKPEPNPAHKNAPEEGSGAWTPGEIAALLGSLGGDLINETIEKRTHHTIRACYAKLRRLGHWVYELRSIALTVDELAEMFQVSPRRVQAWKEKGWLKTTRRRVTGKDLAAFLKEHHGLIAFDALDLCIRTFLIDLGYPAKEAASFKANVKAIMETVAGRKKRCDAQTSETDDSVRSEEGGLKRALDKIARWNQLKGQRIGPNYHPWPSSLAFAAQAAG